MHEKLYLKIPKSTIEKSLQNIIRWHRIWINRTHNSRHPIPMLFSFVWQPYVLSGTWCVEKCAIYVYTQLLLVHQPFNFDNRMNNYVFSAYSKVNVLLVPLFVQSVDFVGECPIHSILVLMWILKNCVFKRQFQSFKKYLEVKYSLTNTSSCSSHKRVRVSEFDSRVGKSFIGFFCMEILSWCLVPGRWQ